MSVDKAKAHFLGTPGYKRLNCGQAIMCAFQKKIPVPQETVDQCRRFGGGNAPEGNCGSFHAAKVMLENSHPQRVKECADVFMSQAGSLKCAEIRKIKKLSCLGCVEKIAEFLERI